MGLIHVPKFLLSEEWGMRFIRKTLGWHAILTNYEKLLDWNGLVMRREDESSMKSIMRAEVNWRHCRGWQKKRWGDIIQQDMKSIRLKKEHTWWPKEVEKTDQSGWPLPCQGLIQARRRHRHFCQCSSRAFCHRMRRYGVPANKKECYEMFETSV